MQALLAVGQVGDVGDAGDLLGVVELADLLDDLLRAHVPGQLGDDQAGSAGGDLLHLGRGPHPEGPATGVVGVAHAVQADDPPAGGQVRAGHEAHQVVGGGLRVGQQVPRGGDDLAEVVRGHVGGHAHGDARGAVDQQVRVGGRQHDRLQLAPVVVGREVDDLLVEAGDHRQGGRVHPALGVPVGGRAVVEGPEVAVAVDQRHPQGERLGHPDQGVVDGRIAVRVQLAHHLADDAGALDVPAVGAQAHLVHRVEDPALHRLEPVAGVRQGAGVDDRVRVLQERALHLGGDVDVDDLVGDGLAGWWCATGHGAPCARQAHIVADAGPDRVDRRAGRRLGWCPWPLSTRPTGRPTWCSATADPATCARSGPTTPRASSSSTRGCRPRPSTSASSPPTRSSPSATSPGS